MPIVRHKEKIMNKKVYIFYPMLRPISFFCGMIFLTILINTYYLIANNSRILFILLILLSGIFIFMFMPLLKNQKLILSGDEVIIFSFGKKNSLKFSKDLEEIEVKENEIASYRFNKKGKHYQVSPDAYYESTELKNIFNTLFKKNKINVSVVGE